MKAKPSGQGRPNILGAVDASSRREDFAGSFNLYWRKLGRFSLFAASPMMLVSNLHEARAGGAEMTEPNAAGKPSKLPARLNNIRSKPAWLCWDAK